jgi:DNA polymerase
MQQNLFGTCEPSDFQQKILQVKSYDEFKKSLAASNCKLCRLCEGRTHIVVDRGNPKASIMLVGEGPGENEDLQGQAFVGRGGQLMDKMFLEAGIDTNRDTLIANIVKCRPPENRAPTQQEAETCLPYLKRQMELVKPKFLILLGATAFKHLLPHKKNFSVGEWVGRFFEDAAFPGIRLFLCYHPAYILRDPRKKPVMIEMLKMIKKELDSAL